MTFLATANVVRMVGAEVVFADVDPDSGLMTPEAFERALAGASGQKVRAAIPVHLNGQLCAMNDLHALARPRQIDLVEDACHALGVPAVADNAHSRIACFSTHPVKAIATGEGGVAVTADDGLANRMRQFRSHGMMRESTEFAHAELAFENGVQNPWYYEMHQAGWNYRQPDILCALGVSQLKKHDRLLAPLAPLVRPVTHGSAPHGWHLYAILVDFQHLGMTRAQLMDALRGRGIGTQVHYVPVHRQPY
jgi:dTDP-4-amino-4,6-dideoxygalactose transaminase